MKGSMFKAEPKHRQHLVDDYRDPELPPLPPVVPYELQVRLLRKTKIHNYNTRIIIRNDCPSLGSLSLANILSDPWLIDHLDQVRYSSKKRATEDIDYIKSKKDVILQRAKDVQDRKNRRLQQRDIDQAMKSLDAEGFKLTHAVMQMLLERDVAMLEALKAVQSSTFTQRGTLRTHRDGRFVMTALKQWEQALKDNDKAKAASTLLYASVHFQNKEDPSYYWLVYEMYHLALKSSKGCKGNITEAVIRYLLGKFLLEKAKHFKEAEHHLERACSLSYGYNWTTDFVTHASNDHIHNNSNFLLHILLIKRAANCSYKYPLEAIKLVKKAVRVISQAKNSAALADANYDLATIYNRAHMPDRAVLTLGRALELYENINDRKNVCLALLLKSHCLRRMQDYKEAFDTLKTVVKQANSANLPYLEAKGYKHMAEYFIGKNKYQSANIYLKKSYDLFEQCDLRDELDEVSVLFSYVKAWLRLHDVYYILVKIMSKEKEELFDYSSFVEYGVPSLNRLFALKFVYKLKNDHTVDLSEENVDHQTVKTTKDNLEESSDGGEEPEVYKIPDKPAKDCETDIPEYFAFSDLANLVFDEELDQAAMLFDRMNIDEESEIAVKTLRSVPMQHRESKKSITYLVALQIAEAQKLNCLRHGLHELALLVDKVQVDRKMLLLSQQLPKVKEDDFEGLNEAELWKFTVELQPFGLLNPFESWTKKANESAKLVKFKTDAKPKYFARLLDELKSYISIYSDYDKWLSEQEANMIHQEKIFESTDRVTIIPSSAMGSVPRSPQRPNRDAENEAAKPTKICRCKDPCRGSKFTKD